MVAVPGSRDSRLDERIDAEDHDDDRVPFERAPARSKLRVQPPCSVRCRSLPPFIEAIDCSAIASEAFGIRLAIPL